MACFKCIRLLTAFKVLNVASAKKTGRQTLNKTSENKKEDPETTKMKKIKAKKRFKNKDWPNTKSEDEMK